MYLSNHCDILDHKFKFVIIKGIFQYRDFNETFDTMTIVMKIEKGIDPSRIGFYRFIVNPDIRMNICKDVTGGNSFEFDATLIEAIYHVTFVNEKYESVFTFPLYVETPELGCVRLINDAVPHRKPVCEEEPKKNRFATISA